MLLTQKQLELMRVVIEANADGSPTDLDEILERVSYKPTKQSIQFTIRSLIAHGLIEKVGSENRRGRRRVLIRPTDLGRHFAGPRRAFSLVSSETEEEVLSELEDIL
jgi:DNA-binding MarR family transcriptional regulator